MPDPSSSDIRSVLVERCPEGLLALWLNRPDKRNAIDREVVATLLDELRHRSDTVIVIGSSTPACFCSGADLTLPDAERAYVSDMLYELYGQMVLAPAPILAVLDGPAVGGGAQLALAADFRFASAKASMQFLGAAHGLAVGAWALPSLVGRGRALDLCMMMRTIDAAEGQQIGLIHEVVDDPRRRALSFAQKLATLDRDVLERIKSVTCQSVGLLAALAKERAANRAWPGSVGKGQRDRNG